MHKDLFKVGITLAFLASASASAQWVTFTNQTSTRLSAAPTLTGQDNIEKDFAFADFDHDGDTDLVVMRKFPGSIQSTCTGCGYFRDLILMNENGVLTDRTVLYGSASDAAGSQGMMDEANDRDVEAFDVNNDGWVDLITATTMSDTVNAMLGQPRIYRNLGNNASGQWQGFKFEDARIPTLLAKNGSTANPRFCDLAVADFNGDGYVDLYFVDYDTPETSGTICIDMNNDGDTSDTGECQQSPGETASLDYDNKLLYNWGTSGGPGPGYFYDTTTTKMTATQLASAFGNMCMAGDFNSDSLQDVIRVSTLTGGQDVAVLTNKTGASGPGQTWSLKSVYSGLAPYGMNVADLNNDGKLDFVIADDGQDRYCLNTGNAADGQPNFSLTVMSATPSEFGNTISVGDLNKDGKTDVIITDIDADLGPFCPSSGRRTKIFKNTGTSGNLLAEDTTILPTADLSNLFDVAVFDINNDGWLDLVTGGCAGLKVWINQPPVALTITLPSGAPSTVIAGGTTDVPVAITALIGAIQAGSETLHYRINAGTWSTTALISGGAAGSYFARLPATQCGQEISYYVSARSTTTGNPQVFLPANAPVGNYTSDTITGTVTLSAETFEAGAGGWVASADATLTSGGWQRGDPIGSTSSGAPAEPADDHTPAPGINCFVTQLGLTGQTSGAHDVDGGGAYLVSPIYTNSGADCTVSFWRWYFCSSTTAPDPFETAVSVNGGQWQFVNRALLNTTAWEQVSFRLSALGTLGNSFQLRFSISDNGTASTLEAGIDDISILMDECISAPACPADVSGDGVVSGPDLTLIFSGWGGSGQGDANGDGLIDGLDLGVILGAWGNCP